MIPESKYCPDCKTIKPSIEFYERQKNGRIYLSLPCKQCRKEQYENTKDNSRFKNLEIRYGVDRQRYDLILESQNGCCDICKEPFGDQTPEVDHVDAPFHVRGLVHKSCNQVVPQAATPDLLRKAAEYLETRDKRFHKESK